ncbi:hypothetical protein AB0937_01355 [Streptomyces sp. NPDC047880]|uniref:hypothetical protein n=1 Tax=Streptomyces sp. NPDC047880 TaxID=3155626 RepID=UPI00345246EF
MVRFTLTGILLMETRAFLCRRQPDQEAKALVNGEVLWRTARNLQAKVRLDEGPAADE